jgi:hypothetical protein
MVALTFPDGARRDYPDGVTGTHPSSPAQPPTFPPMKRV